MVRLNRGSRGPRSMPRLPRRGAMARPMGHFDVGLQCPFPMGPMMRGRGVRPGLPVPHFPPGRMPPPPGGRMVLPPGRMVPPPPGRMVPPPGRRMGPPHLRPSRPLGRPIPHPPLHPMDIPRRPPLPPIPGRRLGMPPPPGLPPLSHGPPLGRPLRLPIPLMGPRGMGGPQRRGVKRLGASVNGPLHKKASKRKVKTEDAFFCETCDRGFKTHEKFDSHVAEHEVCGRDGCSFTAHPKIVMKHVELQHDTGLYHRIVFTQNPEDVAKWIAERKSRFPTKANVEKKEAQQNEMMKRGERIPEDKRPFKNDGRQNQWQERRQGNNQDEGWKRGPKRERPERVKPKTKVTWRDPESWRGDLPKFSGTAAFPLDEVEDVNDKEEINISDEDENSIKLEVTTAQPTKPLFSSILASLIANYGSDMSDDDDENATVSTDTNVPTSNNKSMLNPEVPNEKSVSNTEEKLESSVVNNETEEDVESGPEECKIYREDNSNIPIISCKKESNPNKDETVSNDKPNCVKKESNTLAKPRAQGRPVFRKHQLSLLEMLLKEEIRHERNVILQCVRYVTQNNFLNCASAPSKQII